MIQESVKYKELFNITLVVKNDPYDDDGFDSNKKNRKRKWYS